MTDNKKPETPFVEPSVRPKRGRPFRFTMELADRIYHCARYGMSNDEIAWTLGFNTKSLENWLANSEVFKEKFNDALMHADGVVERSLYHRAKGMKVIERTVKEKIQRGRTDEEGEPIADREDIDRTVVEKELPPDPYSCVKWLANRRPEKWKEKPITHVDARTVNNTLIDQRNQIMVNFNAQEVANLILNEYPSKRKAIADAVAQVIGVRVEGSDPAPTPIGGESKGHDI